ncbi:MAG: hypothetical protein GYA60_09590, partial [Candidatus Methanofastidiosa archaeon]|nr:hypothetical protein [Candidatus Methanofastidiosa archaeon]
MNIQTYLLIAGVIALVFGYLGFTTLKVKGIIPGLVAGLIIGLLIIPAVADVDMSFNIGSYQGVKDNQNANITFKTELSDYNSSISSYDRSTKTLTVPIEITDSETTPVIDVAEVTATFTIDRTDLNTDSNIQGVTTITHNVPQISNEDTTALTTPIYPVAWRSGFTRESFDIEYDTGIYDKTRVVVTTTQVDVDVVITPLASSLNYLDEYE